MKYELLKNDTISVGGATLYRIKYLINIGSHIKVGDLGGYIESEKNLDQDDNATVFGAARVCDSAIVWIPNKESRMLDYICFSNVGSRFDTLTAIYTYDDTYITVGCFNGTIKEFEAANLKTHGDPNEGRQNYYGAQYERIITFIKDYFCASYSHNQKKWAEE